jgi:hypothetical protein
MGRLYYSRVGLTMLAKHNSSHCLGKGNCKPLGGFSVWAALPPLDPVVNNTKPITLVVAQIDGIDMFHEEIVVRSCAGTRGAALYRIAFCCVRKTGWWGLLQAMPTVQDRMLWNTSPSQVQYHLKSAHCPISVPAEAAC